MLAEEYTVFNKYNLQSTSPFVQLKYLEEKFPFSKTKHEKYIQADSKLHGNISGADFKAKKKKENTYVYIAMKTLHFPSVCPILCF